MNQCHFKLTQKHKPLYRTVINLAIGVMNAQIEKLTAEKLGKLNAELVSLSASETFALRNAVARFQASEKIDVETALWGHATVQHWMTSPVADKIVLLDLIKKLA